MGTVVKMRRPEEERESTGEDLELVLHNRD